MSELAASGKFSNIPVKEEDIGPQLLPILSKGLYTNPLHSLREYIQNGVDAGASEVLVKITGDSLLIRDNGKGMNLDELTKARKFGVSDKDPQFTVGFRGIGIYSGYDLCDRLIISSKQKNEINRFLLEFDFKGMRAKAP